uniref:tetratricopeptide repeat protein n=1 Tax=Trichocoleus desertorum TaxID=1481672 RepID=UPI0025B41968|nr:hypothetical protein [Trichocoleus desertorum]
MKLLTKSLVVILSLVVVEATVQQGNAIAQTAYVNEVKGKVELKRKTWAEFRPISRVGTPLVDGDQLRRASNALVVVACPNGKKQPVRRAEERIGLKEICPQWKGVISKGPPPFISIGGTNAQMPYLILPRLTLLLTPTPTLRWHPVPKATQYTVQVVGPQGTVWQTQTKSTQIAYPSKPALQSGVPYSVVIQANTGQSSQAENTTGTEFIILRDPEVKAVRAEVAQILQGNFSNEVKSLKLANYYSNYELPQPSAYGLSDKAAKSYRLTAEAIAVLEDLTKQNQQSPLIYRTLGDLYWQIGLVRPAESAYLGAIANIQYSEDLEEWALAMSGLGELYEATQNPQQALLWYSQAKIAFTLLEDQRAKAVDRRIQKLRKATDNLLSQ